MNKLNNNTNLEPGHYYLALRISFHGISNLLIQFAGVLRQSTILS